MLLLTYPPILVLGRNVCEFCIFPIKWPGLTPDAWSWSLKGKVFILMQSTPFYRETIFLHYRCNGEIIVERYNQEGTPETCTYDHGRCPIGSRCITSYHTTRGHDSFCCPSRRGLPGRRMGFGYVTFPDAWSLVEGQVNQSIWGLFTCKCASWL